MRLHSIGVLATIMLFTSLSMKAQLPNDLGLQPGTPPLPMYVTPPTSINNPDFYSNWFHKLGFSWNLYTIQCPMAWEITKGKNSTVIVVDDALGKQGQPVQNHPDISAKMTMNSTDNVRIITDQHNNINKNNDGNSQSGQFLELTVNAYL